MPTLQSAVHESSHYFVVSTSRAAAGGGTLWARSRHVVVRVCESVCVCVHASACVEVLI